MSHVHWHGRPPIIPFGGFPQYDWKVGISGGAFPTRAQFMPVPGIRWPRVGLLPSFGQLLEPKQSSE
jgi:hypothetical protein